MSKPEPRFAALLSAFLLAACGSEGQMGGGNAAGTAAEANRLEDASRSDPAPPDAPANGIAEPVPPPDAVSHPDGYLPPAPEETDPTNMNSPGPNVAPPATEDEYIRNRQAGR